MKIENKHIVAGEDLKIIPFVYKESATLRVFYFLSENKNTDFSITDIAKGAKCSRGKVYKIIKDLLRSKLLKQTRKIGTSRLFKLKGEILP